MQTFKAFYIEGYTDSTESDRVICAELESPDRTAFVSRNLVRGAVRHCGLETTEFRQKEIESVAAESE